ncbi:hypothetical protein BU23DRAFT_586691 [Bimuria novae-zelandiae CBS 107.79]|uniref:Tc1-like transposase DDE domain-containing protein n=1 Tax=Bimuria novae-zelandiae CBS 107.79 TaxID=1447943 RepID=A0A6A5VMB8_9PLEO|nr:hypothetical protein BU23DRAFT_586691 [Bimuria novae-zelandiae CBS 107.79]
MVQTRAKATQLAENSHAGYSHHDTPTKVRVLSACQYLDAKGIKGQKASVFRDAGVSKARGWEILRQGRERRRIGVDTPHTETRGRPALISPEDLRRLERIIEDCDVEGRSISWEALAYESGLDVSWRTVKRAMGTLNYHKCIACRKGWVNKATAANRKQYAELMLSRYPHQQDWHHVRFSDEVHIGLGPQGKLRIIRKPGQRYCHNCIQHSDDPTEQDKNKIHAWAAVGYRFKSDLIFYDISSNTNGKMTQRAYIDQILNPVEDRDSGHGTSDHNIVRSWKEANSLTSYLNCASSPDLTPIENTWSPMKQYVGKYNHWDVEATKELAVEGWDSVRQKYINNQVLSMPRRLQDVIDADGAMTGW